MHTFPSAEWFDAYREAINDNDEHRAAAVDWEGDVTLVVEADPLAEVPEDVWAWLDLWHGECRAAEIVDRDRGERSRYIISAPYQQWKDVINGKLEPLRGMTQGKLKLRGDLAMIAEYSDAANLLVSIAASIPTTFPDG